MADPVVPTTASKSDKFNQAVARATGKTVDTGKSTQPIGDAAAMFSKFDPAQLNEMAKSGLYEFAPQMMTLEPGMKIEGILEGYGPGNDFEQDDGSIRHVNSWIVASPDGTLRVSILSSSQLDTKLPPFIGLPVVIARNTDIKLAAGHRCGDYHVGGPRLKSGGARRWGTERPHGEIAASPELAQLPAGVVDANPASAISNGAHVAS